MTSRDGLEMEATITSDASHLFIHYRVKNAGPDKAFLLNRVNEPDRTGMPHLHKDNAYVYVDDRSVVVVKSTPAVPEGLQPNELIIPYMTYIPPGDTFQETVELPLPIQDTRPYGSRPPSKDQVSVSEVRFVLGYVVASPSTKVLSIPVGKDTAAQLETPPGAVARDGKLTIVAQVLSAETGKPAPVPAVLPEP